MSCLLAALDDPKVELKPECRKMLSERKEMWEYAAKVRTLSVCGFCLKYKYNNLGVTVSGWLSR